MTFESHFLSSDEVYACDFRIAFREWVYEVFDVASYHVPGQVSMSIIIAILRFKEVLVIQTPQK